MYRTTTDIPFPNTRTTALDRALARLRIAAPWAAIVAWWALMFAFLIPAGVLVLTGHGSYVGQGAVTLTFIGVPLLGVFACMADSDNNPRPSRRAFSVVVVPLLAAVGVSAIGLGRALVYGITVLWAAAL